jgi:starvation-inducible DNA-binding protein
MMAAKPTNVGRTFSTHNDLPADTRQNVIALLNQQLADSTDLYSHTKHAHWNIKGANFIALHKLLDELAEILEGAIDEIAERATALGGVAHGTTRHVAANTRLAEFPHGAFDWKAVVTALVERYADLAKTTRHAIDESDRFGDKDTADLFTEVSRELDKALWFLEAHLQS